MKGKGGGKYVSAVSCTPHINLRPPNTLPRPLKAWSTKQDSGLKKKKPPRDKTAFKLPKTSPVSLNSTFKTVLKTLRWSVVQISVFAVAQVLTTMLNTAGFTSWVHNLHHMNLLVHLTGCRLMHAEFDSTGPQPLVKALFLYLPCGWYSTKHQQRAPCWCKWWHSSISLWEFFRMLKNSDLQFQDHVGGA